MNHKSMFISCIVLLFTVAVSGGAAHTPAGATFTVDSTADAIDANPGDGTCATAAGECTLRAAVQEANALAGADTIDVPAGTYTLTIAGTGEHFAATGDVDIRDDLTLTGAGAASTIIDGGEIDRVFHIVSGTVEIADVTIRNGAAITSGPSASPVGGGVSVGSGATLTLTNSTVTDNTANAGGGINNSGGLNLINSTISENSAEDVGITNPWAGGIRNLGTLTLINSTISGNQAHSGGGIWNSGTLTLTNSTVSSNIAGGGSGIRNQNGTATLTNVTVANNTNGGAISHFSFSGTDVVTLKNTIVANNSGENCTGDPITSDGHNLDSGNTCSFAAASDLTNTNPLLGPLADNGGPAFTHALLAGSPAIDAGDNTDCPTADQRGVARPMDGDGDGTPICDIGAYEYTPAPADTPTPTPTETTTPTPIETATPTPTVAGPPALVVNNTDDVDDGTCDAAHCSLREALKAAGSHPGPDTVTFNIPTTDPGYDPATEVWTIQPAFGYNVPSDTTVDGSIGTTLAGEGNSRRPGIEIDGPGPDSGLTGLSLNDNVTLRGLVVNHFFYGVWVWAGSTNVTIEGCYVGTDPTGTSAKPNGANGILVASGATAVIIQENLVSGNGAGIRMFGETTAGNILRNNRIGTDASGTAALPNEGDGIRLHAGPHDNTIGPDNLIAYNSAGIQVLDTGTRGNTITRNRIHSNGSKGIQLTSGGNNELAPPVINTVNATQVSGTACPNCVIEIFSDAEDEGAIHEGTTTADPAGNWTFTQPDGLAGPNVTATATDAGGNTSAFSAPVAVEGEPAVRIYLPIVLKNYPRADVIFHNGTILTMEADQPQAQAIAVRGEKILAVGSEEEVLALRGAETQVVDLQGRTLMPGFVDAHTHIIHDSLVGSGLSLEEAQQLALENGITTLAEMFVPPDFLEQMQNFAREGRLRVRTSLYLIYTTNCGDIMGDWYTEHPPTRESGEMLRIGGIKIYADGGTCGLPAVSFEYPDRGGHGDLWLTQARMNEAVAEAHAAGYQVAIHAQGDLAIEQAQNAIQFALAGEPNTPRHRIDHNSFAHSDLLPRYSEIGIVAVIFGYFPTCAEVNDGALSSFFGAEPMYWLEDWRAFLDANPGLHIAWHGDDPWVGPISPLLELYSLVTRKEVDEDGVTICEPPDWLAAHAITVEEALPMMTIEAAYALFRDEEVGSLKLGKYADLVILSGNPLTVDPDAIKDMEVLMTMVGGHMEYCAPGQAALCPLRRRSQNIETPEPELDGTFDYVRDFWPELTRPGDSVAFPLPGRFVMPGGFFETPKPTDTPEPAATPEATATPELGDIRSCSEITSYFSLGKHGPNTEVIFERLLSNMVEIKPQRESTPPPYSGPGPVPTPELREATYVVEIAPQLPAYTLLLIPSSTATELRGGRYLVGWVQVSREDSGSILQTITVEMDDPHFRPYWTYWRLITEDINFDGYLDIAITQQGGAKWGRFHWWLFDADSESFHTNSLTEELRELKFSRFFVDPQARQIHINTLVGVCQNEYTYQIANGHLALIFAREYEPTSEGCVPVTRTPPPQQ